MLKICGLEYRVVFASVEEVPELAGKEGFVSLATNTIYVLRGMPASRTRDALAHEVGHAFFEATGIGSFIADRVRGDYDRFEETLIRLLVQQMLRLLEDNGSALLEIPKGVTKAVKATYTGPKKVAGKRR
jgi:hypothetical protein